MKVAEMSVNGFIASLKIAPMALLIARSPVPLIGMVELTAGAVVSGFVFDVRNEQADIGVITNTMIIDKTS